MIRAIIAAALCLLLLAAPAIGNGKTGDPDLVVSLMTKPMTKLGALDKPTEGS